MKFIFNSYVDYISLIDGIETISNIANESSYITCSPEFIRAQNAPITNRILKAIENTYAYKAARVAAIGLNTVIDTRVTQTMAGMFPSIPGWHCDNVPRADGYEQPDLSLIDNRVKHFMCYVSSCSEHTDTEFAIGEYNIDINKSDVWGSLDRNLTRNPEVDVWSQFLKEGQIVRFSQEAIHRASPTLNPGWRLWFRLSFVDRNVVNEIRKNVQVYTTVNGW